VTGPGDKPEQALLPLEVFGLELAPGEVAAPEPAPREMAAPEPAPREMAAPEPTATRASVRGARAGRARTAQDLAARQRSISVSEFFLKNRHLLGFDNPTKALLTTIKEAVDNALDACEDAGILPEIKIEIREVGTDRYAVMVEDNGPGIVKAQVPRIFGQLLYGSKFHVLRQARGQQGIGISAAGMYAHLTTGRPTVITTRPGAGRPAHRYEVSIDTRRNTSVVARTMSVNWDVRHGTRVALRIQAVHKRGRRSVDGYIEQTALVNPHAHIHYAPPRDAPIEYKRLTRELPREAREIKPHPHGVELGALLRLLRETKARELGAFLASEFSRVSPRAAKEICERATLRTAASPVRLGREAAEKLHRALEATKLLAPATNCLSPLGAEILLAGLKHRTQADFYTALSRPPAVYRGNPFQVEVALAHGDSNMGGDNPIELLRFANRVPLLYQQSACAIAKATMAASWKNYGLTQARGALPLGPMVLVVHIASVWVPFTSESKEAIAHYPEILREVTLALQACGRKLATHLRKRRRAVDAERKRLYLEQYLPHVGIALREMLALSDKQETDIVKRLQATLARSRSQD